MASGGRRLALVLACIAAVAAVVAPAALSTSGTSVAGLEAGVLQELNAVRADHGLVTFRSNVKLALDDDAVI